jgi:hypothetical protein
MFHVARAAFGQSSEPVSEAKPFASPPRRPLIWIKAARKEAIPYKNRSAQRPAQWRDEPGQTLDLVCKRLSARCRISPATKGSQTMRRVLFTALPLAILSSAAAMITPAAAVTQDRYCLQGRQHGYPGTCHFSTYDQCNATASGTGAHCGINPRYAHHHRSHGQSH